LQNEILRHVYKKTFFRFCEPSVFSYKVSNKCLPKINIVEQNFRVPKDAEFYAESKFVEKVEKSQAQLVR
jgi:hypothetical protein